jgi:hypothetical protein
VNQVILFLPPWHKFETAAAERVRCGEVPAWPGELREMASCDVQDADATAAVLTVPEDLALFIASFLGGETLARLEATSKACRSLYANEAAWEACVRARWHDPRWLDVPADYIYAATNEALDSLRRARRGSKKPRVHPKQCGASSWASAYRELHRRNAPPRSWLTPRHAKVVARGRQGAVSAWALVRHTPDCRCVDGSVTLRVVVQNTGTGTLSLHSGWNAFSLSWLVAEANDNANAILRAAGARELQGREHARAVPRTGTILNVERIARGHERMTFPTDVMNRSWLQPLEWVATEVRVATGDCVHEHDFLERAIQLGVKSTAGYLKLPFIDDATVHRMYSELPGGYVMLSDGV